MSALKKQTYQNKSLKLTNTLGGKKSEFRPKDPKQVLFYSCGPTVYGPLHIGNARALYTADTLFRWLKYMGYGVNYVRNYTDIDDKILARAKDEGSTLAAVGQKYLDYCETDMKLMKLDQPTKTVRVTESVPDIIAIIEKLIARGHAYVVGGEVFYAISTFSGYGKLSGKNPEELQAGVRIEVDGRKKNPLDFSLWKPAKTGEPSWSSPWGEGRPGWHIECSAMILRWLGESIDIHHGGQDLIFPHHENEIAQTEGATGHEFCGHWVHNGFLTISREKMSKSLGNILEIRQFIETYGAEVLKYLFVKHHYRAGFDFNDSALEELLGELERIYLAKRWARSVVAQGPAHSASAPEGFGPLVAHVQNAYTSFENEIFNDLNSPGALGAVFSLVREINRTEAHTGGRASEARTQVAQGLFEILEGGFQKVFNVFGEHEDAMLAQIEAIRRHRSEQRLTREGAAGAGLPTDAEIQALIAERKAARGQKDFKRSDEIRDDLAARGIVLLDAPTGTTWKTK